MTNGMSKNDASLKKTMEKKRICRYCGFKCPQSDSTSIPTTAVQLAKWVKILGPLFEQNIKHTRSNTICFSHIKDEDKGPKRLPMKLPVDPEFVFEVPKAKKPRSSPSYDSRRCCYCGQPRKDREMTNVTSDQTALRVWIKRLGPKFAERIKLCVLRRICREHMVDPKRVLSSFPKKLYKGADEDDEEIDEEAEEIMGEEEEDMEEEEEEMIEDESDEEEKVEEVIMDQEAGADPDFVVPIPREEDNGEIGLDVIPRITRSSARLARRKIELLEKQSENPEVEVAIGETVEEHVMEKDQEMKWAEMDSTVAIPEPTAREAEEPSEPVAEEVTSPIPEKLTATETEEITATVAKENTHEKEARGSAQSEALKPLTNQKRKNTSEKNAFDNEEDEEKEGWRAPRRKKRIVIDDDEDTDEEPDFGLEDDNVVEVEKEETLFTETLSLEETMEIGQEHTFGNQTTTTIDSKTPNPLFDQSSSSNSESAIPNGVEMEKEVKQVAKMKTQNPVFDQSSSSNNESTISNGVEMEKEVKKSDQQVAQLKYDLDKSECRKCGKKFYKVGMSEIPKDYWSIKVLHDFHGSVLIDNMLKNDGPHYICLEDTKLYINS